MAMDFLLDPILEGDTRPVGDLPLSRVLLMNRQSWIWVILVPRQNGAVELTDLPPEGRAQLMEEIALVEEKLTKLVEPDKLNVASFGNVVRQLHVHVIARNKQDAGFPDPVWAVDKEHHGEMDPANLTVWSLRLRKALENHLLA